MEKTKEREQGRRNWMRPTLTEQADRAEAYEVDTLLYCSNPWGLRHHFINQQTGEVVKTRCNRWECLHCGPRKVDLWRQLVKVAEPELFLTLTKAGRTVEQAARALTTFTQALRRGSRGKGPHKVGARSAYPVEYFAVLERHRNFEENGFHWHILLKGVDRIPYKEVIQPLWRSATHGDAEIGHVERIRNARAIGYVTKYLTKAVAIGERGTRDVERERVAIITDELGEKHLEKQVVIETIASKAHRIRYSRQFFPERVAALRKRLFAGLEDESMEQGNNGKPLDESEEIEEDTEPSVSPWKLVERKPFTNDIKEYKQRKREALERALEDMNQGRRLSRRVIHAWKYQRDQLDMLNR